MRENRNQNNFEYGHLLGSEIHVTDLDKGSTLFNMISPFKRHIKIHGFVFDKDALSL